jgi:lipoprotein-anchoring transpeptidase ErfK/SrfK
MAHRRSSLTTLALIGAAVASLALSGCMSANGDGRSVLVAKSSAVIHVNAQGSHTWNPSRSIVVRAQDGKLTHVQVHSGNGADVKGKFFNHQRQWRSSGRVLDFGTKYRVKSQAIDESGLKVHRTSRLKTVSPKDRVYTSMTPGVSGTFGVGMPIIVTFDKPVTRHALAQEHMEVTTTPKTVGAWHWVGDQMVRWRPKHFWKPGTKVTVTSNIKGLHLSKSVWGDDFDQVHFSIGDAQISTVNIASHEMTVRRDGKVVRTIPVTTGKPGWDTRVGTKVIISKQPSVIMDASTIDVAKNSPDYYRLKVLYAMRLTWSGEYLHAAPWSEGDQGVDNVSHGCTGMSTANAIWLYDSSKIGDPVTYINGTRPMEPWNGYTDWNMSWKQWKAGSAIK